MIEAILIGLAAFRLASLFTREDGPFYIFTKLRNLTLPDEGELNPIQDFLFGIYSCMWCATVWFVPVTTLLWLLEPWIVIVIAAMAIAVIAEEIVHKGE